jgi:hypothetical protein
MSSNSSFYRLATTNATGFLSMEVLLLYVHSSDSDSFDQVQGGCGLHEVFLLDNVFVCQY